jgi:SnoaL-like protein
VTREEVQAWLDAYVAAWKSYERAAIEALFSEDVEYRYHPYDEPIRGREAVVRSWLGEGDHPDASERDEHGTYDAAYAPVAVDEDVAVATGASTYLDDDGSVGDVYDNCFVMRFDADGRCRQFTEWYVERPD